jgi:fucokinase
LSSEKLDSSFLTEMVKFMSKKHVLLIHAGGDSKRVPWANPMGKIFLPLPYLAGDIPDGPVPLLFDHILAISSCSRQAFKNKGLYATECHIKFSTKACNYTPK